MRRCLTTCLLAAVASRPCAPLAAPLRWNSSTSSVDGQQQQQQQPPHSSTSSAPSTMDLAAAARREIYDLWGSSGSTDDAARSAAVAALLAAYKIDPSTPREEDVCRGLGDALDRLLLLCVPLPQGGDTASLEAVLACCARHGRQLSVRTVQHLFARTATFPEALAIFYALRRAHVAMSVETYHAMLYSLQRLEEEGWAQRLHEEYEAAGRTTISERALDFVLRGVDSQLIPENKPWLGRVMFAEGDRSAAARQSSASFDQLGKMWVQRYKGESS